MQKTTFVAYSNLSNKNQLVVISANYGNRETGSVSLEAGYVVKQRL